MLNVMSHRNYFYQSWLDVQLGNFYKISPQPLCMCFQGNALNWDSSYNVYMTLWYPLNCPDVPLRFWIFLFAMTKVYIWLKFNIKIGKFMKKFDKTNLLESTKVRFLVLYYDFVVFSLILTNKHMANFHNETFSPHKEFSKPYWPVGA